MTGEAPSSSRRRAVGYALLGRGFDYILHLRPMEWPIVTAHLAVGALLAVGLSGAATLGRGGVLLGVALWIVCLNGGTLAINSAFDRDEGDVAYLRAPPPPPKGLFVFGLGLMVAGLVAATRLPPGYRTAYGVCLALSVLYSVPPFRLKAVAGVDWLINMWGFGTLTPFAGWALTTVPVTPAGKTVLIAFCPLFAGLYPLTQLYQLEEDLARGDWTMAAVLGPRRSLDVAVGAVLLAFALLGLAGVQTGWRVAPPDLVRWTGLAVGAASWAAVLVPWRARAETMTPAAHQRAMYRALAAWAVTDVAVLAGFAR